MLNTQSHVLFARLNGPKQQRVGPGPDLENEKMIHNRWKQTDQNAAQHFRSWVLSRVFLTMLTFSCAQSSMAQDAQTGDQAKSDAEVSKEAANPLSSVWLMQIQQNNTWIGMPANGGNRVQSNLQFQQIGRAHV